MLKSPSQATKPDSGIVPVRLYFIPNNALVIERRFWSPSGAFREGDTTPDGVIFQLAGSRTGAGCAVLTSDHASAAGRSFD